MSVNCNRIDRTFSFLARSRMSLAVAPRTLGVIEREAKRREEGGDKREEFATK
jgi:hypothetical protein